MSSLQQPRSLLTTAIPLSPSPHSRGFIPPCTSPSLSLRAPLRNLDRNLFFRRNILRAACMRSSASESFPAQRGRWQLRTSNPGNGESSRTEEDSSAETSTSGFRWRKQSEVLGEYPQRKPRSDGDGVYLKSFPGEPKGRAANQSLNGSRPSMYRDKEHVKNRSFSGQAQNGTSERRHKNPKIKEQIRITSPLRQSPHVAILGGGMSGLICALTLQEKGIRSTVFDTGKHGLGGRMGTRHIAYVDGSSLIFDHAAQYFTATDARFQELVNQWMSEGAVKEWDGIVGTLEKGGAFSPVHGGKKYIASKGMRLLADHILSKRKLIDVKRPCWISKMMEIDGLWHLSENGQDQGTFDMVVIAHNGKCANRLLAPVGVPLVAKQMKRLELSSIWALMAAFQDPLPSVESATGKVQIDGAFVTGVNSLSWMGNNTSKLELTDNNGPYCWTFFSTATYGKKNKVPQESIPTARAARVKREMLEGVESALGLSQGSLPTPIYMRVQLWGAALPLNTPNEPCIFDAYGRVGICGDWLLGSNLEAAALSGMAMANQISSFCNARGLNPEGFCIGLTKELVDVKGHDIGQFSHQENRHETPRTEVLTAV